MQNNESKIDILPRRRYPCKFSTEGATILIPEHWNEMYRFHGRHIGTSVRMQHFTRSKLSWDSLFTPRYQTILQRLIRLVD